MRKVRMFQGVVFFIILLLLASCTPKAKIPSASAPQATPSNGGPVKTPTVVTSSEEAAWTKVVEAAKKEGKVTFYSVSFIGTDAQVFADAFYQKYGIKVEIIGGQGTTNYERLRTEKRIGQIVGDVVQSATPRFFDMKEAGILKRVTDLPVIQNKALWEVDPLSIDPDGYVPVYEAIWMVPLVNTKLVPKEKEPKSLKDLLKPEWKGKILFVSPMLSSFLSVYYLSFVNKGAIDWSYLEAINKQDLGWSQGTNDTPRLIAKGDFAISNISWSSSNAPVLLEGGPIKAISMEEGDPFVLSALAIVEGSPHPNAAKVFMNWLFGKEAATLQVEKTTMRGSERLLKDVPSGIPEPLVPPLKKRIIVSKKDLEDGGKLYVDQYIAKLMKLK